MYLQTSTTFSGTGSYLKDTVFTFDFHASGALTNLVMNGEFGNALGPTVLTTVAPGHYRVTPTLSSNTTIFSICGGIAGRIDLTAGQSAIYNVGGGTMTPPGETAPVLCASSAHTYTFTNSTTSSGFESANMAAPYNAEGCPTGDSTAWWN